ncbi:hypothetical protein G6F46_000931 [Rhizopus delemar]|uniref:Uncharacterized protein n=3 Tax=Rhizopus TaxID=4842 RepID=I1BI34_RHIO9|nr:hypothetical protein RO3G_00568 [Rhizopus delemar RA 99-880]KAG1047661.1 hypothetical protein G6F43_009900 [Rhizopus delemar]KAG1543193.1 hypothetical protein G6F51_006825 [Rhizopus arrhizus]EIE75865.1 hypothetical protein RO3G_00569 [Rhizopus delemar RA 99-880]KAG1456927.1 hypothetical protein G6F55_006222 [Rhizopus delemar]|eukprot:EIE75864.1 hypothetical protein RO3G_00568 [Rhizopus delemar RA 99-880]
MLLKYINFFLLFVIGFVAAANRGTQHVPGLGKRKQAILKNGGGVWDLAIAMLESDKMMTDYPYGDNKSGDSANFGIFKQNWFMLRTSTSQFKGQPARNANNGAILNKKLRYDIKARQESQKFYGADKWFGGHRNGESGLNNPYTQDITNYKNAVNWIHDQLVKDKKYLSDDTRFWVDVVAI